jgi:hypothetical protein
METTLVTMVPAGVNGLAAQKVKTWDVGWHVVELGGEVCAYSPDRTVSGCVVKVWTL